MKAMILAAGLGTRLKPWTDHHPKALAMVNGKSLLQRNIEYLQQFGIFEVVVNIHHFADQIVAEVEKNGGWGSKIVFSDETDEVLETGGGLKKAATFFENGAEPFLLMNADILTNLDIGKMLAAHSETQSMATLAVANRKSSRYLLFDDKMYLCGWKNDKSGEQKGSRGQQFAFSGIHILNPKIFGLMSEQGKFSLIDVYLRLCNTYQIFGFEHSNDLLLDVGKPESLILAQGMFN